MIKEFKESIFNWGKMHNEIDSILLVGSYARHEEKSDSDIDLVVVVNSKKLFLENLDWINIFGKIKDYSIEDWGLVQSVRVFYENSFEVEFGLTESIWTDIPVDKGTYQVISDGSEIIIDKTNRLKNLLKEVARQSHQ
jgi:predicted nucleotidyltransferase